MRLFLFILLAVSIEARRRHFPQKLAVTSNDEVTYEWDEYRFKTKLDNFDFTNTDTFEIRYLANLDSYKSGGPIFFYTGNEGVIESFANATGLMWDLAPTFNAAIVLAEHRYYGDSQPFTDYDTSYSSAKNLAYLSSEQALADYAALLQWLKRNDSGQPFTFPENTKVIAFGGSYGGMLSAWFRVKYPHICDGAYASSAPVIYFKDAPNVDYGGFDKITTETFKSSGCDNDVIAKSWTSIKNLATTDDGRSFLNNLFQVANESLIKKPEDADALNDYIREAIEYMAMTDYAYSSSFLKPMPAWPVKYSCNAYLKAGSGLTNDTDIATAMAGIASVYFNFNNDTNYKACFMGGCPDAGTDTLGSPMGWPWQECTEIVMTMCARGGTNDFFWDECAIDPIDMMNDYCTDAFAVQKWNTGMLGVRAIQTEYGFTFNGASNIIFTNGDLDPWRAGGISKSDKSRMIYATSIKNSAHHFDLRQPNKCDPSNVVSIRYQAVQIMRCWVDSTQCNANLDLIDGDSQIVSDDTQCDYIINGYPWGVTDVPTDTPTTTSYIPTTTTKTASTKTTFALTLLLLAIAHFFHF